MNSVKKHVFSVLIVFFVLFSLLPSLYEFGNQQRLPSIRVFELVHNFPTDYNFYLSRIRQGLEGRSNVKEMYTGEPHEGSLIQVFYLFLGRLGRTVRVPVDRPWDVYHMARIVLGCTLLLLMAECVKRSFTDESSKQDKPFSAAYSLFFWQVLALLLIVTAGTWPKPMVYNGGWRFGGYMPWWSLMDSLQRITFIPHLLAGQALILFILMQASTRGLLKKIGNWIFLGLLSFVLGIIFPPGLIFVAGVFGVMTVLEILSEKSMIGNFSGEKIKTMVIKTALPKIVIFVIAVPSLLYLSLMTSFYPWHRLVEVDTIRPLPFDYAEYFLAVGPILVTGIAGMFIALIKREKSMMISVAWVVSWLLFLWIFHFIPAQSPLRFSEMIPQVPLGILTAYACYTAFTSFRKTVRGNFFSFVIFHLSFVIPIFLILIGLGVMVSSWWWQRDFVDHKMSASYPLVPTGSYVMYPLKDFVSAMYTLRDQTSVSDVILSETTAGNYIPAYIGRVVYAGHDNTVKFEEKKEIVRKFFSGQMSQDQAREFLQNNTLRYIFFGPQEREDGGIQDLQTRYPFLKPIYSNTYVTLYSAQF